MKRFSTKYLVLADQALFSGLSFMTTIWIARSIDANSFGIYSAWILAIYLVVSAVGAWSIQPFQIRYNKISGKSNYISFVFWGQIVLLLLFAFVLYLLSYFIKNQTLGIVIFFGIGFVFYDFMRKVLLVLDRVGIAFLVNLFTALLTLSSLAYLSLTHQFIVENYMLLVSISFVFVFFFGIIYLKPFHWNIAQFKNHFSYHFHQGKWFFYDCDKSVVVGEFICCSVRNLSWRYSIRGFTTRTIIVWDPECDSTNIRKLCAATNGD